MNSEPQLKRRRTEEPVGDQVVMHRSMLSRHSIVWKDMFKVPQPYEQNLVAGCPVIQLSDDEKDLEHVLGIFYDNLKGFDAENPISFPIVAAMIRLGHKYQLDYLRDMAVNILKSEYPSTLELWDEGFDRISRTCDDSYADIVSLASEFSLNTIRPCVYLMYVTKTSLSAVMSDPLLSREEVACCVLGRDKLVAWINSTYKSKHFTMAGRRQDCQNHEKCSPSRRMIFETFNLWEVEDGNITVFPTWNRPKSHTTCKACYRDLQTCYDEVRMSAWKMLPSFFGLPDWEDLKDFDM
ncbi:unnamed protein product [Cyclocybe aegerita]|uniref:BTB domain-containing protein n=1 Tax=Cyclocybe aegerita TaxID=1973307 RepID=A0A8S0WML1_CYCAE|nr:unnamed protein product [Cyclocybe aegerita]